MTIHSARKADRVFTDAERREELLRIATAITDSDPSNDDLPYWTSCLGEPLLVVPYTKTYQDARYLVTPGFSTACLWAEYCRA